MSQLEHRRPHGGGWGSKTPLRVRSGHLPATDGGRLIDAATSGSRTKTNVPGMGQETPAHTTIPPPPNRLQESQRENLTTVKNTYMHVGEQESTIQTYPKEA